MSFTEEGPRPLSPARSPNLPIQINFDETILHFPLQAAELDINKQKFFEDWLERIQYQWTSYMKPVNRMHWLQRLQSWSDAYFISRCSGDLAADAWLSLADALPMCASQGS